MAILNNIIVKGISRFIGNIYGNLFGKVNNKTINGDVLTNVPSNAVFTDTDTKVTSAENHYTPSTDSNSALSVDASSSTLATWDSTQLVTGVNINRDTKGHVTGLSVDSIKLPDPNSLTKINLNKSLKIYLSSSGDDDNDGLTEDTPMKTFSKVFERYGYYQKIRLKLLAGSVFNPTTEGSKILNLYNYSSLFIEKHIKTGSSDEYNPIINLKISTKNINKIEINNIDFSFNSNLLDNEESGSSIYPLSIDFTSTLIINNSNFNTDVFSENSPNYKVSAIKTEGTSFKMYNNTFNYFHFCLFLTGNSNGSVFNCSGYQNRNIGYLKNSILNYSSSNTISGIYDFTLNDGGILFRNSKLGINNLEIPNFSGATSSANGSSGLVPTPLITNKNNLLCGDGSWKDLKKLLYNVNTTTTNTGETENDINSQNALYSAFIDENKTYTETTDAEGTNALHTNSSENSRLYIIYNSFFRIGSIITIRFKTDVPSRIMIHIFNSIKYNDGTMQSNYFQSIPIEYRDSDNNLDGLIKANNVVTFMYTGSSLLILSIS